MSSSTVKAEVAKALDGAFASEPGFLQLLCGDGQRGAHFTPSATSTPMLKNWMPCVMRKQRGAHSEKSARGRRWRGLEDFAFADFQTIGFDCMVPPGASTAALP